LCYRFPLQLRLPPMPHLLPRVPSAGCALILLTALGPASDTPAAGAAMPVTAAVQPTLPQPAPEPPRFTAILIPCITGMCQVPLHEAAALTPLKPGRPTSSAEPTPYVLASAGRQP
jgi:hypothetical protein